MASNFDYEAYYAKRRHTAIEKACFELAKAEDMKDAIADYVMLVQNSVLAVEVNKRYEKECSKIQAAIAKAIKREYIKYEV